jgi:hypothetical protein
MVSPDTTTADSFRQAFAILDQLNNVLDAFPPLVRLLSLAHRVRKDSFKAIQYPSPTRR